jgi:hypothetical protein
MHIGSTDAGSLHFDQHFLRMRDEGHRPFLYFQFMGCFDTDCFHVDKDRK